MNLLPIAVRALFAYVTLLVLVRLSGKRAIRQATAFNLALSLVLADLVDNAIFAEAPFAEFAAAAAAIMAIHITVERMRAGSIGLPAELTRAARTRT